MFDSRPTRLGTDGQNTKRPNASQWRAVLRLFVFCLPFISRTWRWRSFEIRTGRYLLLETQRWWTTLASSSSWDKSFDGRNGSRQWRLGWNTWLWRFSTKSELRSRMMVKSMTDLLAQRAALNARSKAPTRSKSIGAKERVDILTRRSTTYQPAQSDIVNVGRDSSPVAAVDLDECEFFRGGSLAQKPGSTAQDIGAVPFDLPLPSKPRSTRDVKALLLSNNFGRGEHGLWNPSNDSRPLPRRSRPKLDVERKKHREKTVDQQAR